MSEGAVGGELTAEQYAELAKLPEKTAATERELTEFFGLVAEVSGYELSTASEMNGEQEAKISAAAAGFTDFFEQNSAYIWQFALIYFMFAIQ